MPFTAAIVSVSVTEAPKAGQIPQGPQGPQGPAGPAGPAGPGGKYALVAANGSIVHQSGGISLAGTVGGYYYLNMGSDMTNKNIQVTSAYRDDFTGLRGGVLVTQDMTKYIELLKSFNLPGSFATSLELLTEIPNLFTLRGEALKDHLRGVGVQTLAGIERGDLKPYIQRREDSYTVAVQSALGSL